MNKVSIIITTLNRPEMLKECLCSIVNDDYPDIEIIVVDDNSEKAMIIKAFLSRFNLIYHRNFKNLGISASRNKGLELSTGDYVRFIDDDDKLIKGGLAKQVKFLDDNPSVDIVYSNLLRFDISGIIGNVKGPNNIPAGTPLMKKSILDKIKFSEKASGKGEDGQLWIDLKFEGFNFIYLDVDVHLYRMHTGQMTNDRMDGVFKPKEEINGNTL